MIDEKKLAELRAWHKKPTAGYDTYELVGKYRLNEMLDTIEALWKVARAAINWERMKEVAEKNPDRLLSGMVPDVAVKVMNAYYESERLLLEALQALGKKEE